MKLALLPGPVLQLTCTYPDEEPEIMDVTAQAHAYLYRIVDISPDIKLSDLLGLLNVCPTLIEIYGYCNAEGLAEAARLGPQTPSPDASTLEYLELYRLWDYDGDRNTYMGPGFIEVSGVGPYSEQDMEEFQALGAEPPYGEKHWCVSLTPVRTMLDLPVRMDPQIGWIGAPNKHPRTVYCHDFLLGDVLHGLLRNLSWFGDEDQQQNMIETLIEANAGLWTPLDLDALLKSCPD